NRIGTAELVQERENLDLGFHLLGHGFDHQVGFARSLLDGGRVFETLKSFVGGVFGDLAQLDRLVEVGANLQLRLAQGGRENVFQNGAIPAQRGCVRDASAHNSGADYSNGEDFTHRLLSLFQLLHDVHEIGIGVPHVFGETLLLLATQQVKAAVDAAQRCGDIVDVVHHANQFTSRGHKSPFERISKDEE